MCNSCAVQPLLSGVMTDLIGLSSMREAAGQSTKSALSHTFLHDSRDDTMGATRGIYSKIFTVRLSFLSPRGQLDTETWSSRKSQVSAAMRRT